MYTLASRSALAAVDGAPVPASVQALNRLPALALVVMMVTVTGGPATYAVRGGIDMSPDGGTTWTQVVRFKDITNAQVKNQVVRASANTAIGSSDFGAVDLTGAAAAAVVVETPWSLVLRASTQLQALTGGTAPTVTISILGEFSEG